MVMAAAGKIMRRLTGVVLCVALTAAGAVHAETSVVQPIEFPHARHAGPVSEGGHEINCLYCHSYARRSQVAGIPTLAKCMGCHRYIATDKPAIQTLTRYWREGRPVPWKKVHDLPDFVYFSHERHVQRFVFRQGQPVQQVCGYCHGDIKTMTGAQRRKPLRMGWCLSCHEQFQNHPATVPSPPQEWLIPATDQGLPGSAAPAATASGVWRKAPSDCWQCHQ